MSVHDGLKIGGGVIWWALGSWYNREQIRMELSGMFLEALTPEERPPIQCLRTALQRTFRGRDYVIANLVGGKGLEVTKIVQMDEDHNIHEPTLVAKLMPSDPGSPARVGIKPFESAMAQQISDAFNEARGLVSGDAVSDVLTFRIKALGGNTLRPRGGIYWLPEHLLNDWTMLTNALDRCVVKGNSASYLLRHIMDEQALRAIHDAITREVEEESKKLLDDVVAGSLGTRGLENRKLRAQLLTKRVKEYESILGMSLERLLQGCESAESAAAAAEMLAAAQTEQVA